MKFQKLAAPLLMLTLSACGADGPSYSAAVEHDSVVVHLDTWYHPPGLGERIFGGADGLTQRISIAGKTVAMSGNYVPREWDEAEELDIDDYSPNFWAQVADKFNAIKPPEKHAGEHRWLYRELVAMRDAPLGPANKYYNEGRLTADYEASIVSHAGPDDKLTTDGEDAASKIAGEAYVAWIEDHTSGDDWGANMDPKKLANRGFRDRMRTPGFEFKQRLEVWAESAFGTGFDHSGTIAFTYRRRIGEGEWGWKLMHQKGELACNHGACPRSDKMQLRHVCDSRKVSNWYIIDGECEGDWGLGHLCNDDTSVQINHAQGVWTGNKCPGSRRGIVPKCGRQF